MSFLSRAMGLEKRVPAGYQSPTAGNLVTVTGMGRSGSGWELGADTYAHDRYNESYALEKAYYRNVYVYKAIHSIANSISGCPFRAGDPLSNNFNLNHPLAKLLGPAPTPPNPMLSSAMLWRHAITSYLTIGKFAWLNDTEGGTIARLWPLQAQALRPVFSKTGPGYFDYFKYGNEGTPGYKEFSPDQVTYIWHPSLVDPRLPESPLQPAMSNIDVAKLIDQFDLKFLKNGGVPAHLVVTPQFATPDDRATFQQQFLSDFGGAANAGRTMFAEREYDAGETGGGVDPVDIKTIGTSQRDAELHILRQAEIQAICIALGVPLSILGDASHRTFSNADAERRNYWLETLLPLIRELQDQINTHLAPKLGNGKALGWFDTREVPELRKPPAIPDNVALNWVQGDLITADELRADRGLPPGADVGLDKVWAEKKKLADEMQKQLTENPTPPDDSPSAQADPNKKPALAPAKAIVPARSDFRIKIFQANADACEICKAADGTENPEFDGEYDTPHPNCKCDVISRGVRHPGHDHKPVPSGHLTNNILETMLTKQVQMLLEDQSADVKQRLSGRRSKKAFQLYDAAYWTKRAISTLEVTLTAMGKSQEEIEAYCADLIAGVANNFETYVPADSVKSALMKLHSGAIDLDAALAQLQEVA